MKGSGGFYFGNPQEIAAKRKAGTVFLLIFLIFAISEKMLICEKKKKDFAKFKHMKLFYIIYTIIII